MAQALRRSAGVDRRSRRALRRDGPARRQRHDTINRHDQRTLNDCANTPP
jgi:hypothetical protein